MGRNSPWKELFPEAPSPASSFQFSNSKSIPAPLTLISDGILEAQRPDGELFGFDRISAHICDDLSASSLATAAQNFGQSDDITVLTLKRVHSASSLAMKS
jgi:serine phosphatase RsbU (regulator of sigma subunit)